MSPFILDFFVALQTCAKPLKLLKIHETLRPSYLVGKAVLPIIYRPFFPDSKFYQSIIIKTLVRPQVLQKGGLKTAMLKV